MKAYIPDLYNSDEDAWEDEAQQQLDDFFGAHVHANFISASEIIITL